MEEALLWYESLDSKIQDIIRQEYIYMLVDQWYTRLTAENTDDWRDEYILDVYQNQ